MSTPAMASLVDLGKRLLEASKKGQAEEVSMLMTSGAPFTTDWVGMIPLGQIKKNLVSVTARLSISAAFEFLYFFNVNLFVLQLKTV
jgi:hypothetical protein